jgi:hypothetical protein
VARAANQRRAVSGAVQPSAPRRGLGGGRDQIGGGVHPGRRGGRSRQSAPEFFPVQLPPEHGAAARGCRAVLDQAGGVGGALPQRPKQRAEVQLAAVGQQQRAQPLIQSTRARGHVQPPIATQGAGGGAVQPSGPAETGQQAIAAKVRLHGSDRRRRGASVILGRQRAVVDLIVAAVSGFVQQAAPQHRQAGKDAVQFEEAIATRVLLRLAGELLVCQLEQFVSQRLRPVGGFGEQLRQPVVAERDRGQRRRPPAGRSVAAMVVMAPPQRRDTGDAGDRHGRCRKPSRPAVPAQPQQRRHAPVQAPPRPPHPGSLSTNLVIASEGEIPDDSRSPGWARGGPN